MVMPFFDERRGNVLDVGFVDLLKGPEDDDALGRLPVVDEEELNIQGSSRVSVNDITDDPDKGEN
jgi:hypothetical protein